MIDVFKRFSRLFGVLPALFAAALTFCALAVSAPLGAAEKNASQLPSATGINAILGSTRNAGEQEFLEPDQAFRLIATADGPDKVRLEWVIHEGYYLYKSRIKVASTATGAQLGTPVLPAGKVKNDEYFGVQEVYHEGLVGSVPVARSPGGALELPIDVTYQGCADAGLCYPPVTKNLKVNLPGSQSPPPSAAGSVDAGSGSSSGYVSPQDRLLNVLRTGNLAAVIAVFFLSGLLLAFTPCVLPMIPILSGLITGQGANITPLRGFTLAFTYVQGMALTYAAAGAICAAFFGQAPQGFFQQPWIIALFAALFVALAFAMFGAFTLQLPSALQTRLTDVSNKQKSGNYVGVLVMGALSALIVTACVAPAIVAALSVIAQSRDVVRGASALYATGIGMGAPLLLVGASAGSLLPRVGAWMDTVKSGFGLIFLALALYFGQQLIPPAAGMLLWSALAVISGFWIFSIKGPSGTPAPAAVRAPGLLALVYGVILLIGLAAGSTDPLQPLSSLRAPAVAAATSGEPAAPTNSAQSTDSATAADSSSGPMHTVGALSFETVKSLADLQARVAAAKDAGKTVMLDFYADWCTSCKEMERYTFTDASVQAALGNTILLRADVTKNDAQDQALLKHFGIFGPPTIAFYNAAGAEQQNFRVVGYMKAGDFAALLRKALDSKSS